MPVSPRRIRDARIIYKDTLEQLAEKLGVTKQAVSKYENGKMIPSQDVLERMLEVYELPADFLLKDDLESALQESETNMYCRKTGQTASKKIAYWETLIQYAYEILQVCARFIPINRITLPDFDREMGIEEKAACLREYWGLGQTAIYDLEPVLSRFGIYTFIYDFEDERLDGCAKHMGENGVIILNSKRGTQARQQFDLAHELGHLVLQTDSEESANYFAGAFLLPKSRMGRGMLRANTDYLLKVKNEWGVSLSCVLERHRHLNLLDNDPEINYARYEYLKRKINNLGWRKCEPGDQKGTIGEHLQIGRMIENIWGDVQQRDRFWEEMYIPFWLVRALCGLDEKVFSGYRKRIAGKEFEGAQLSFIFT